MPVRMVTCIQCDKVFAGNELSKHKRNVHGPSNRRQKIPLEHPPSPPDVQEDRRSFKANIQNIVREFDALPSQAIEECSNDVGDMPVFGVSPSMRRFTGSVNVITLVRHCMRIPIRT